MTQFLRKLNCYFMQQKTCDVIVLSQNLMWDRIISQDSSDDDKKSEGEEPKEKFNLKKCRSYKNNFVIVLVSNDKSTKSFAAQVNNLHKNEIVITF